MSAALNYEAARPRPHHHPKSRRGGLTRLKEERKPRNNNEGPRKEAKKFNKITPTPLFVGARLHTGFSTPVDNQVTI